MRWTMAFIPTLEETPGAAEIVSHKQLLRAGLIRKLSGGVYTPVGVTIQFLQRSQCSTVTRQAATDFHCFYGLAIAQAEQSENDFAGPGVYEM